MVWKMIMVEEYQDGCLVLGNRWNANEMNLASLCSRGYMVWKKRLVEEFRDGCLMLDPL